MFLLQSWAVGAVRAVKMKYHMPCYCNISLLPILLSELVWFSNSYCTYYQYRSSYHLNNHFSLVTVNKGSDDFIGVVNKLGGTERIVSQSSFGCMLWSYILFAYYRYGIQSGVS